MRGYNVLLFALALPVFGALGHDAYITYHDQDFLKPMMFSDVGYLWTHYSADTYTWAKNNFSAETWHNILTPVLEQMTILVAAIPFLITLLVLLVLRTLGMPPFEASGGRFRRGKGFGFGSGDKKQGKFKYKRK